MNILAYSGGADSGALAVWMQRENIHFTPVFCDTGWEHPMTYAHIADFNTKVFRGTLVTLKPEGRYVDMPSLVQIKKRVPSAKARFCTQELKVEPMKVFLAGLEESPTVYQGIRADESEARRMAKRSEWSDVYDCLVERPLLTWTKAEVFAFHKEHGIPVNPLYLLGAGRVGCFPCVLINQGELRRLTESQPEIWDRIEALSGRANGRSFFPPKYIPDWACTGRAIRKKDGKEVCFPTNADVKRYVLETDQEKLDYTFSACMSVYNLCE